MPTELRPCTASTPIRTRVLVVLYSGPPRLTRTRSEPWQRACGQHVVLLDEIMGGYSLDRVWIMPEEGESDG